MQGNNETIYTGQCIFLLQKQLIEQAVLWQ